MSITRNRLLETPAFVQALRAQGIELVRTAEPKQSATTQRWKLRLRILESGAQMPTKIEFSRRGIDNEAAVEPVDPAIIRMYRLYPVILQHYGARAAFAQKVTALALRDQAAAIENALAVDYDAFAGQVLAYLEPEYQEYYGNKRVWDDLQEQVVNALEALQP